MGVVAVALGFAACVSGLQLSSTEDKTLVYNGANPYDFGHVQVGGMTAPVSFTLTNLMGDDDTIMAINKAGGGCVNFDIQGPPPLGSAGSYRVWCEPTAQLGSGMGTACTQHVYTFTAAFRPTQPNASMCALVFVYSPTNMGSNVTTTTITLQGFGDSQNIDIAANPSSLPMGGVQINTTRTLPGAIAVSNKGTVPVTISATSSNPLGYITISSMTPQPIAPSGSAFYDVTCEPMMEGSYTTTFTFTGMGSGGSDSDTTTVTCQGVDSQLVLTPVTFPDAFVGTPPMDQDFTVSLTSGTTTISKIALDAMATSHKVSFVTQPPTSYILTPTNPLTVKVHYAADVPNVDPLGSIVVSSSGEPDRSAPVRGTAEPADVATNPTETLDFGTVCLGNKGTKDLEIYASDVKDFHLQGYDAPTSPVFSVTGDISNVLLQGGHQNSAMLQVSARPTALGTTTDKLVIHTEIPMKPTVEVDLAVKSLMSGVAADTDMLQFGSIAKDITSGGKDVMFTNCTGKDAMITNARIEGPAATDFTIVKPNPPTTTIPDGGALPFTVVMTPHDRGDRAATLVVDYTDGTTPGTVQVALDGNGVAGMDTGGNVDRETYYACSASGGHARDLWPIAVALVFVRRRRKPRAS